MTWFILAFAVLMVFSLAFVVATTDIDGNTFVLASSTLATIVVLSFLVMVGVVS